MSNFASMLSHSLKDEKDFKDAQGAAASVPVAQVPEEKVILLHHHGLSDAEKKILFQGIAVISFDSLKHSLESAGTIMAQAKVLIVDLSDKKSDEWYRKQANWVKDTKCNIVYLAEKGIKCSHEEVLKKNYGVDHIKKYLDPLIDGLESLVSDLLIPHIPAISRDNLSTCFSCAKAIYNFAVKK